MEVQFTFPNLLIMEEQVSVKPCCLSLGQVGKIRYKQEGPSLESSSYLNVSLRYLGPLDPGTMGPCDAWTFQSWTLGLLDLFPPPTPPHTSPYNLLHPPISSSYSPPLVWFG